MRKNNLAPLLSAYSATSKKLDLAREEPIAAKPGANVIDYKEYVAPFRFLFNCLTI